MQDIIRTQIREQAPELSRARFEQEELSPEPFWLIHILAVLDVVRHETFLEAHSCCSPGTELGTAPRPFAERIQGAPVE